MPPIPNPPRPPPEGNAFRYLSDIHSWLCSWVRHAPSQVASTPPVTTTHPYKCTDASVPGDGWYLDVHQGYFLTANRASGGVQNSPVLAVPDVVEPICYLYLHAEFDDDEILDGTPELVLLEDSDPVLTADPFAHGYLQLAKIEQIGDVAAPSLRITQFVVSSVVHRKVNRTHIWGYSDLI